MTATPTAPAPSMCRDAGGTMLIRGKMSRCPRMRRRNADVVDHEEHPEERACASAPAACANASPRAASPGCRAAGYSRSEYGLRGRPHDDHDPPDDPRPAGRGWTGRPAAP